MSRVTGVVLYLYGCALERKGMSVMQSYDVVIVGAGHGGAQVARISLVRASPVSAVAFCKP